MTLDQTDKDKMEELLLYFRQQVQDEIERRYYEGDLPVEELQEEYDLLSEWEGKGKALLTLLS